MINFTDKRYYVKGTCSAILSEKGTGDIVYYSDKFQTGNLTTEVNTDPIRAGMGNGIAAIIPSDSALNVEFAAADFSLWAKMASIGGTVTYTAPVMKCQVITPQANLLRIDVSEGVPVPQLGMDEEYCYVQEVGVAAPVGTYGQAYRITAAGMVNGFTGEANHSYKVWYFVNEATAALGTVKADMNGGVYHFTAQMPVYANESGTADNTGSRIGWLYCIVPALKLNPNGGVVGDQGTADTTTISGQAMIADPETVSATCEDCAGGGDYAYYVFVKDDGADDIVGLAIVGGVVTVTVSTSKAVPVRFVMQNGQLATPASMGDFAFSLTSAPSGTTVSNDGIITAGATEGDCDLTVNYNSGEHTLTAAVSVVD